MSVSKLSDAESEAAETRALGGNCFEMLLHKSRRSFRVRAALRRNIKSISDAEYEPEKWTIKDR
jgi:hypothetical protein